MDLFESLSTVSKLVDTAKNLEAQAQEKRNALNNGVKSLDDVTNNQTQYASDINYIKNGSSLKDNPQIFDHLPHLKEILNGNNVDLKNSLAQFLANDGVGSKPSYSYYQKYLQGKEAGEDFLEVGRGYVFITKPNLNLKKNAGKMRSDMNSEDPALYNSLQNGFFQYISNNYPYIIDCLTQTHSSAPNFIPLLFNHYNSISLESHTLEQERVSETFRGYSMTLPGTAAISKSSGSINISYQELADPIITYLHKVWFEYIDKVHYGECEISENTRNGRELDYTSSLYYIGVGADGETLNFWGKYTGLFPSMVPYETWGGGKGDIKIGELNCTYFYSHKDFLLPEIIMEFNNTFGFTTETVNTYIEEPDLKMPDEEYYSAINSLAEKDKNTSKNQYSDSNGKGQNYPFMEKSYSNFTGAKIIPYNGKFKLIFLDESGNQVSSLNPKANARENAFSIQVSNNSNNSDFLSPDAGLKNFVKTMNNIV